MSVLSIWHSPWFRENKSANSPMIQNIDSLILHRFLENWKRITILEEKIFSTSTAKAWCSIVVWGGVKLQYTIYTSSYANLRNNKSSQASSDSLNLPNYNGFGREHMPLFNAIQYLASVKANASGGHMSNQRPLGKDASNISNNDGLYEVPTIGWVVGTYEHRKTWFCDKS